MLWHGVQAPWRCCMLGGRVHTQPPAPDFSAHTYNQMITYATRPLRPASLGAVARFLQARPPPVPYAAKGASCSARMMFCDATARWRCVPLRKRHAVVGRPGLAPPAERGARTHLGVLSLDWRGFFELLALQRTPPVAVAIVVRNIAAAGQLPRLYRPKGWL